VSTGSPTCIKAGYLQYFDDGKLEASLLAIAFILAMASFAFWNTFQSFLGFLKRLLLAHWRSLLALSLGIALPLLLFGQLALVVYQNQGGFPWDEPILVAIHTTARPAFDQFAAILTKFGVFWGVFPVSIGVGLGLLSLRRWRSLAYLLTTLLGSVLINRTAKEFLHRVRPHLWTSVSPELDYAFPSGHAMSSMTIVAALLILSWGSVWAGWVLLVGSVFVVAIAWTRLYLGVHFPSDILAGWLVSVAWAIGVSFVIKPHLTQPTPLDEDHLTTTEELTEG
jgi:membrane-associated phospholipid phosphatase